MNGFTSTPMRLDHVSSDDSDLIAKAFQAGMDYALNSFRYNEGEECVREVEDKDNPYPNITKWKKQNGVS